MLREFKNKQGHTIKFYDYPDEVLPTNLPPLFTTVFSLPTILYQGEIINYEDKWGLATVIAKNLITQPYVQITKTSMKARINTAFIAAIIAEEQLKETPSVKTHLKMATTKAKKNIEMLATEVNNLSPDTKKGFYAIASICGQIFNNVISKAEKGELPEYLKQINQIE